MLVLVMFIVDMWDGRARLAREQLVVVMLGEVQRHACCRKQSCSEQLQTSGGPLLPQAR